MARFNQPKPSVSTPTATNLAGGKAFTMSPRMEFASAVLTSLCSGTFYQTGDDAVARIGDLTKAIAKEDGRFAAKAALFARHQNGLRSVTHIIAAELAHEVKGEEWLRPFFQKVAFRVDDITETLAYYIGKYGKKGIPNSMRDGFGKALASFDGYQLAKYVGKGHAVNLFDAVNICHPKANIHLTELMTGKLKPAETWETKLSAAGSSDDVPASKATAWKELIQEGKLGYLAALRNIRNVQAQAPEEIPALMALLADESRVEKSKVLPFQFKTAMDAAGSTSEIKKALNLAMDHSLRNVPVFPGRTLIALDTSGSMAGRPADNGALFAAVLFKAQPDADLMMFSDDACYSTLNPGDSLSTLVDKIHFASGGTNFHAIFARANRAYDRIVILSDMQGWMCNGPGNSVPESFKFYCRQHGVNPFLYSFNLNSVDGTLQFPESKVFCLAGFTDSILSVMQNLEKDRDALVNEIELVPLGSLK